mgnify:FL=1
MFVKDFMTKNPVTVPADAPITFAADLMQKKQLKRLPVVEGDQLVGIVTEKDIAKALPSPATTLSRYEINYLTEKITVSEVMTKKVYVTNPEATAEEATMLMRQEDVGCLPVLDNGKLVGIITESNVFDALTKLFGLDRSGLRITVHVQDRLGVIADLTTLIKNLKLTIISIATYPVTDHSALIVLRIAANEAEPVIAALQEANYEVVHVTALK